MMPTYVGLVNFTEQGVSRFRDTRKRAAAFEAMATKAGVNVREVYWTLGRYDGLLLLEAPDDKTVTALMLNLASQGNVRTETMRAFDTSEVQSILAAAPRGSRG